MKDQPRQTFDEEPLNQLAQSIRTYGVLQPLIVTPNGTDHYTIIAGERRWRAAQLASLPQVPCIVRKPDEHSSLEIALIENIQREELSPVEEATTLERLIAEYNYTQETLAAKIGKERSTVSNALRLLSLPPEILDDLKGKRLTAGHARALCGLDESRTQLRLREIIHKRKLSVRQTEEWVKRMKKGRQEPKKLKDPIPQDLRELCDRFKGHLSTKVHIDGSKEKGRIEISYYSLVDLERIAEVILNGSLDSDLRAH
jgi:ParB family chromosome partitioning protein